jgi:hypothetical protein
MQWNLACAQLASVHVEHHISAAWVCGRWVGGGRIGGLRGWSAGQSLVRWYALGMRRCKPWRSSLGNVMSGAAVHERAVIVSGSAEDVPDHQHNCLTPDGSPERRRSHAGTSTSRRGTHVRH